MRVCIEFFGELRFWEEQKSYKDLKIFLENKGYNVDVIGTFWKDKYSKSLYKNKKLNSFDSLELIPYPKDIEFNIENLERYYYCLYKSRQHRIKYQKANNYSYQFIILTRSDIEFQPDEENSQRFLELIKTNHNIHGPGVQTGDGHPLLRVWINDIGDRFCYFDDKSLICTESAANLISLTYIHSAYGNDSIIKNLKGHNTFEVLRYFSIPFKHPVSLFKFILIRSTDTKYIDLISVDMKVKNASFQNYKEFKKHILEVAKNG